jgi:hypothetical protein
MSREHDSVVGLVSLSSTWVLEATKFFDTVAIASTELMAKAVAMAHVKRILKILRSVVEVFEVVEVKSSQVSRWWVAFGVG